MTTTPIPTLEEIAELCRELQAALEPPERIAICHPSMRATVDEALAQLDAEGVRHNVTVKTCRWVETDQIVMLDPAFAEKALAKTRHPSTWEPVDSPPRATQRLSWYLGSTS